MNLCCFIFTSFFEGIPLTILESLASGIPTITSDVGGIHEVIVHQENGILIESLANDDAMAREYVKAIIWLLENPQERARFAVAGLSKIHAQHGAEAFENRLQEIMGN